MGCICSELCNRDWIGFNLVKVGLLWCDPDKWPWHSWNKHSINWLSDTRIQIFCTGVSKWEADLEFINGDMWQKLKKQKVVILKHQGEQAQWQNWKSVWNKGTETEVNEGNTIKDQLLFGSPLDKSRLIFRVVPL